jgi:hypothetical protein
MEARRGLAVPKIPVRVELAIDGAAPRPVEVYVSEHRGAEARRQHVIDLLLIEDDFLPMRDLAEDTWAVVNKTAIAHLAVPLQTEQPQAEEVAGEGEELFDVRRRVRVDLRGGAWLEGELLYSPRPERTRVTDYLNDAHRFFPLWTASMVFFLNKRFVARILEL